MPRIFQKEDREYILSNPDKLSRAELGKKFGVSEATISNLIYNSTHQNKIKEALQRANQSRVETVTEDGKPHDVTLMLNGVDVKYDATRILVKVRTDENSRVIVDIAPR